MLDSHPSLTQPQPVRMDSPSTLYVDLDGGLSYTDTLWESLLAMARKHPLELIMSPLWLLKGKAGFKREIARRCIPEVATLPMRPEVLELIARYKDAGSQVVLATAADERIAEAVAKEVAVFDHTLASDGITNLSSEKKLAAVLSHAGGKPFDYLGDSSADVCLLARCEKGYFTGSSGKIWAQALRAKGPGGAESLARISPSPRRLKSILKAMRPHQWSKNLLVGVPLFVSHRVTDGHAVEQCLLAMASFSLAASSIYIVNDLLDLPSDRAHPSKRNRPFASGALPISTGVGLAGGLLTASLLMAFFCLGRDFGLTLLLYLTVTTLYSAILKRKLVLDVMVLAGLYTVRIIAGAAAIGVRPSQWLLGFSIFVFTALAMVKRFSELRVWRDRAEKWPPGRGYTVSDMDLFRSIGAAASCAAVLVFALYISSADVVVLYTHPQILWLACPVMLYWLTRLWFLTNRTHGGASLEDPVLFALKDRASIACAILLGTIVLLAK